MATYFREDCDLLRIALYLIEQEEVVPADWAQRLLELGWIRDAPEGLTATEAGMKAAAA